MARRRRTQHDSAARFDRWSSTYESSLTWRYFFDPVHEAVVREVGGSEGTSILDVACGTGDMLRRFAAEGAARLAGVDASEGMLDVARELCGRNSGIELARASAEMLPFRAGEFDIVTSCIAFHHFPDPRGALSEMARVLRPRGRLYICDMNGEGLRGRLMLTYGRMKAADDHYYSRETLSEMAAEARLRPTGAKKVRLFPAAFLVTAVKTGD